MTDLYTKLVNNPAGKFIAGNVGLPRPIALDRHSPGDPVIRGRVLVGAAPGGRLNDAIARTLEQAGADARHQHDESGAYKALVFDATGIKRTEDLVELHRFFSPSIRGVQTSGRVIVLGTPMEACPDPREATAQRALEGFTRSVGKEVRKGATAQLVKVHPGAEDLIDSTLRFLLSPKSAYVSGQVVEISPSRAAPAVDWERPLAGRVALVTGASRGIGAAIAATLARDGAHVLGVDVPPAEDDLRAVTAELGGSALALDITDASAPKTIAEHLRKEHGGVDIVVHNAGITRDKTLGRMDEERWTKLMEVNVTAPERITEELLSGKGLLRTEGRIVGVSSISGIAGNAGQTNYATSKAAVIGFVRSWAPRVAEAGGTINAVAPGFIETAMTAAMPVATREAGRRLNSLSQGGLPVDVAETIAWFANPASGGVNGNVVRVCGQSLIGA
jgi:3-oxoacyl-[acyl-carrier protein] reductase